MNPVRVRNIEIGTGIPKICVPIVGRTRTEIEKAAHNIGEIGADVVEWRVDWYDQCDRFSEVEAILQILREILGETPVLFTFRTAREGGEKAIDAGRYAELNQSAVKSGYIDMIDAELFTGDTYVEAIIEMARECGVKVIVSNHDFDKTPAKEEIIKRLNKMQNLGADILKIAVMPQNHKDVLTLLAATEEMAGEHADCPIITMSMTGIGVISRLCGEVFGSALTFGTAGKASAPGQIGVKELRTVLELLHKSF